MRLCGFVPVLLGLLVIGGCARGSQELGNPAAPSANAVGPVSGPPPLPDATPPTLGPPSPRIPVAGTRARAVPWTLAGTAAGGHLLLLDVTVGGPPCDLVTAVDVAETAGTVRLTVYAGVPTGASCRPEVPAIAATERVQVHLAAPLGTRTTVDGRR
jgi:hypothetical protein